jgi:hypothetical protein
MKNYFSACATAAKITGIDAKTIRENFRKGAKPEGKVLNAVIVARQLYNGTFGKKAVEAEPAVEQA